MCGIAGLIRCTDGPPLTAADVAPMLARLTHRGPDDEGVAVLDRAVLGHRRLSIIDLAGGAQPMQTPDGRFTLVANGEIYNHADLRRELEATGAVFRSRCDVETILHGYAAWGPEVVERLRGMFAFAIYDTREHRLFLARDRLGQKPLVYAQSGGLFGFASELGALAQMPGFDRTLDLSAAHELLTMQVIPAPRTIYRSARKLPPAHHATVENQDLVPRRYWRVDYAAKTDLPYARARTQLRELLSEATALRLMSDVPLGAFLSGGIDSTVTVGLMSRIMETPVQTFAVGTDDPRYNELVYAEEAAARFHTEHRHRIVDPCSTDLLQEAATAYGEPFADSSALPTLLVSRFARRHVTVALTGDGADEAFAGYERYLALRLARHLGGPYWRTAARWLLRWWPSNGDERSLRARTRRFLQMLLAQGADRYLAAVARTDEAARKALYQPDLLDAAAAHPVSARIDSLLAACTSRDPDECFLELESESYLPDDLLVKIDIASMRSGLETRSPFLDHRVVEFAASLPMDWKLAGRDRKHILIDACADLLPPAIRQRPKMGFGIPKAAWLAGPLYPFAREQLLGVDARTPALVRRKTVAQLLEEHHSRRSDHSHLLWSLLVLELWMRAEHGVA